MTISMYQASVPILKKMLQNLDAILNRATEHADAHKIDHAALLKDRLYPDMLTFTHQVQIATDVAKGCPARLAGQTPPSYEDNEASFPELKARIKKTLAFLDSFKPEQIDGSEERTVELKVGGKPIRFAGLDYLRQFVLPNVFFHITVAYAILRHRGVPLGKADYLGANV